MDFLSIWPVVLLTVVAGTLLWNGMRGLREGIVRIPLQLLYDDEYERGTTMFGFAVTMNFLGGIGILAGLIWWKMGPG